MLKWPCTIFAEPMSWFRSAYQSSNKDSFMDACPNEVSHQTSDKNEQENLQNSTCKASPHDQYRWEILAEACGIGDLPWKGMFWLCNWAQFCKLSDVAGWNLHVLPRSVKLQNCSWICSVCICSYVESLSDANDAVQVIQQCICSSWSAYLARQQLSLLEACWGRTQVLRQKAEAALPSALRTPLAPIPAVGRNAHHAAQEACNVMIFSSFFVMQDNAYDQMWHMLEVA